MNRALILTDGKAGHENQSKAFARAMGCDFDLLRVDFRSKLAKAASYALDWMGILSLKPFVDFRVPPSRYDIVVGTGSGTFYAAKAVAKMLGARSAVVLYPRGYRISGFGCILAPEFDNPAPAPNVIRIPVNLVAADAEFYASGVRDFRERHADTGREAVAVIVGGPNRCSRMTAQWMRSQLESLFAAHASDGSAPRPEMWVTTSRRTPPEVEAVIDAFPFDYKLLYSKDRFNPIPAFVSLASHLYVTAESTGMLSEACSFGKAAVHVMDNLNPGRHKFRRFAESCARLGSKKVDLAPAFAAARKLLAP